MKKEIRSVIAAANSALTKKEVKAIAKDIITALELTVSPVKSFKKNVREFRTLMVENGLEVGKKDAKALVTAFLSGAEVKPTITPAQALKAQIVDALKEATTKADIIKAFDVIYPENSVAINHLIVEFEDMCPKAKEMLLNNLMGFLNQFDWESIIAADKACKEGVCNTACENKPEEVREENNVVISVATNSPVDNVTLRVNEVELPTFNFDDVNKGNEKTDYRKQVEAFQKK